MLTLRFAVVDIPDILPDLAVWGLNSPYMKTPEEYNVGVIGMASSFITEIKRRWVSSSQHFLIPDCFDSFETWIYYNQARVPHR
jgi:hypothetical protein